MKLLILSSVVPANTISGSLLLYRHLSALKDIDVLVVSDGPVAGFPHKVVRHKLHSRILKRLARTSLRFWALDCFELCQPVNGRSVAKISQSYSPDVIMTVAQGALWKVAARQARKHRISLVTIFHDWWPDMAGVHTWFKPVLDRQFRAAQRDSVKSLCVSEGMRQALGSPPHGEVLYPIPAQKSSFDSRMIAEENDDVSLRVLYMGNLGEYGAAIQQALELTKEHRNIRLEARGASPWWPSQFKEEMEGRGLWHDFAPRDQLDQWLSSADAYLVAMSFEDSMRRRMETSFPSKLVDYAQLGKPIVIWGPEYCSAVRWARTKDSALCVTHRSAASLVDALERVTTSEWTRLADKAREAAANEFNPDRIQTVFVNALRDASSDTKLAPMI